MKEKRKKKKAVTKQVTSIVSDTDQKIIKILEEQLRKAEEDKTFLKQKVEGVRRNFDDYKLRIQYQEKINSQTDITSIDHVRTDETLQKEQVEITRNKPIEASKKQLGFLSRFFKTK